MEFKTLSAGVVIVRPLGGEWRYLILRAYRYWDFPKGIVERGEAPLEAACREVKEETTLRDLRFRWGHQYQESEPYNRGKVARYYLAESPDGEVALPVSEELGRPEHCEYRWATYAEARSLFGSRLIPILDWARDVLARGCGANAGA